MCGITGWVYYDRDLTAERATLEAMTQTMACRGPDADGLWIDAARRRWGTGGSPSSTSRAARSRWRSSTTAARSP